VSNQLLEIGVAVPDTFPVEWTETDDDDPEVGWLVLRQLDPDGVTDLRLAFTLPNGWPKVGESRTTELHHVFARHLVAHESYIDGKAPWLMKPTDNQASLRIHFRPGDQLHVVLTLRLQMEGPECRVG
jgi:hypothetical protein